ncbi:BLUF domain-containing protein [Maritalea mediterranea]|uniref:BLUF domain-containing protein n=1 Tax=Maritalea mediterranea TaxID=2909667 RepID=A0ABS9E9A7_9HYPH|nr:BLUF domain-containing protein [Maritalea mediterranea]MCF4099461.1 BLUF domain-containing protein [Maritalea mediterranea]
MIRILYVSTALPNLKKADVDQIVVDAQKVNAEHDITGALAYNGVNFAQVLEGAEHHLTQLMKNIEKDRRHSGVIEIMRTPIEARVYQGWHMKQIEGTQFDQLITAMTA